MDVPVEHELRSSRALHESSVLYCTYAAVCTPLTELSRGVNGILIYLKPMMGRFFLVEKLICLLIRVSRSFDSVLTLSSRGHDGEISGIMGCIYATCF